MLSPAARTHEQLTLSLETLDPPKKKQKINLQCLICPDDGELRPVPDWVYGISMSFDEAKRTLGKWDGYMYNESWLHWSNDGLHHLRFMSYMEDDKREYKKYTEAQTIIDGLKYDTTIVSYFKQFLEIHPNLTYIFEELLFWPSEFIAPVHFEARFAPAERSCSYFMGIEPGERNASDFMCWKCSLAECFHLRTNGMRQWTFVDKGIGGYLRAYVACGRCEPAHVSWLDDSDF